MTNSAPHGGAPHSFLDAGASALVAFSLSALVLLGNNLMLQGTQSLFGMWGSGPYSRATFIAIWIFGAIVPALAALWLARRAHTDPAAMAWQRSVATSAVMLAVVALGYSVLMIGGGLIHDYF